MGKYNSGNIVHSYSLTFADTAPNDRLRAELVTQEVEGGTKLSKCRTKRNGIGEVK